jgi:hypothetical protein
VFKIIMGIIFIVGGLSGRLELRFAHSSPALVVLGAVLVAWGITQLVRRRS